MEWRKHAIKGTLYYWMKPFRKYIETKYQSAIQSSCLFYDMRHLNYIILISMIEMLTRRNNDRNEVKVHAYL